MRWCVHRCLEFLLAAVVLFRTNFAAPAAQRPNVVTIIADDIGYDIWDHADAVYPNLAALTNSGLVFRHAYANPVCSPTRACIMTGRYSHRTGVGAGVGEQNDFQLPLAEVTIPEVLDQNPQLGYEHATIGKWHLSNNKNGGTNGIVMAGFSHFAGMFSNQGFYDWMRTVSTRQTNETIETVSAVASDYSTSVMVDDALAWINARDTNTHWYVNLAFQAIHKPFHLPPAGLHTFDDRGYPTNSVLGQQLAALEAMDTEIGRLVSSLNLSNTTVIFIGDNGTTSLATQPPYDPNKTKHWVYQGGVHVPMFIAGAGVAGAGDSTDAIVNATDIFATVLELAGVDLGAGIEGPGGEPVTLDSVSLVPYMTNAAAACLRSFAYVEQAPDNHGRGPMHAARNPTGLKLIQQIKWLASPEYTEEFYDLRYDPLELTNLMPLSASDPLQTELAALRGELAEQNKFAAFRTPDPFVIATPNTGGWYTVSIEKDESGDTVWLTTNGVAPGAYGADSVQYTAPFQAPTGMLVQARAYRTTLFPSFAASNTVGGTAFAAYNDLSLAPGDSTNRITWYSLGDDGPLVDRQTGAGLAVELALSGSGVAHTNRGLPPASGTDAYTVFHGHVGTTGLVSYGSGTLTLAFSRLDTGLQHELVLFGNRGVADYTNRMTSVRLAGAEPGFRNESSPGVSVETTVATNDTSIVCNGDNTTNGFVARYTDVRAGADGAVELVVTPDAVKFYANALMVRGYGGAPARPAAPTLLAAPAVAARRVELQWRDNSNNETGFKLRRSADDGQTWSIVAEPAADQTSWADNGVRPNTSYRYKIKATASNAVNDSAYTVPLALTTPEETVTNVTARALWRYRKGTDEASVPVGYWRGRLCDDSLWPTGAAPFGYGDGPYGTTLSDMQANYSSVFLRHPFVLSADPARVAELRLWVLYDDGFLAWINAEEVARHNVPGTAGAFVAYDTQATGSVPNGTEWSNVYSGARMPALYPGTNVLAVQVFNVSLSNSSDLTLDAQLEMSLANLPEAEDPDDDTLPELWELAMYGSNLVGAYGCSDDPDLDGVNNLGEHIMGTHPTNHDSCFRLATSNEPGSIQVYLDTVDPTGVPGYDGLSRHYELEVRSGGLPEGDGHWLTVPGLSNIAGNGNTVVYTNAAPGSGSFYRARVWLE